ncbi:putative FBD-associated F-box protein [Prunus yedoensis var. nudiflora]|uniref:Putative FBD-associated F-box protein n=1 Tax=Prunus yedoensis var. nudiflora TaxID=2094558 RepID=A0A314YLC0_PRUYE|nr:putative FBD-associated F-box protein [Prunus yedoensis var. nudiflora]
MDITGADYNHNGVFPRLENLKHLELVVVSDYDQALHHLTYFLKVSPYLQRLVLKFDMRLVAQTGTVACRETGEIEKAAKYHYLKVVEVTGYRPWHVLLNLSLP